MSYELQLLVDGVDFGEGPRWRDGVLWYSDFYQRTIYTVTPDGERTARYADLPDRPSGLGWLPDGRLLVVFMTQQKVMRDDGDGQLVEHADLSSLVTGMCNDMVVAANGNAYVGNFGFDLEQREKFRATNLILVRPDGTALEVADGIRFPNGSVITPDGKTLIVGQTFGRNFAQFDIADDGTLSNRRDWPKVPDSGPDGCALDSAGGIWFSDANNSRVVRVVETGEVTEEIATPMPTYACMLGGGDGRTLFILCAPSSHPDEVAGKAAGAIYTTGVPYQHAGLP